MVLLIVLSIAGVALLWYAGVRLLDYLLRRRVRRWYDKELADLVKGIEEEEKRRVVNGLTPEEERELEFLRGIFDTGEEKKREGEE